MQLKEQKAALRKEIANLKKLYDKEQRLALSKDVLADLECLNQFKCAHTILLYYSLPDEVQTESFIQKWAATKRIVLPVVVGDDLELREYNPDSVEVGYQSIIEPSQTQIVDPSEIDLAIIPGVAFDCQFNRLGRGKGFYDRILPRINAPKIGLAFPFQVVESVPTEDFDKSLDLVLFR